MTITEALAEIKTIGKRIEKKSDFIRTYLATQDQFKDPLAKDGGSRQKIDAEFQAIKDLNLRQITLRRLIRAANESTTVSVNGESRSIADWLVWRREIAPGRKSHLQTLQSNIASIRKQATEKGLQTVTTADLATHPQDVIIHLDESKLAEEIEGMEETLGALDGQLSLKNATTQID